MVRTTLTMTAAQHELLLRHLLPGDGLEAVALALCGRHSLHDLERLLVHEIHPVPIASCRRAENSVTWPTALLRRLLDQAMRKNLGILKIHSHPGGSPQFSAIDDAADAELFSSIHAWIDGDQPHVSAILLPNGRIFGRAHYPDGARRALDAVTIIGDDLRFFRTGDDAPTRSTDAELPQYATRHAQAFGRATFEALRALTIVVVGCSGTGSVVVDILARLGVGRLILIDPDRIEEKNLNRILNAFPSDVGHFKVDVLGSFVERLGFRTRVEALATDLSDPSAMAVAAGADVAFGCTDGVDGRHLLNRLCTFYLIPYIDVGVRLDADGRGGVDQICGSVHYLQPGLSSLMSRRLYTPGQLRAAAMRRHDPAEYRRQVTEKYIKGVAEERPAVSAVNMFYASLAVLDFLARLHPYRVDGNGAFSVQTVSHTGGFWLKREEDSADAALARYVGRGDMTPLLDMPFLDRRTGT